MPIRRTTSPTSEPPSLSPMQAINLLERQLERLDDIEKLRYDDPQVESWESTTESVLDGAFGRPNGDAHRKTSEVKYAYHGSLRFGMTNAELQRVHSVKAANRKALIAAYIEQIRDGIPALTITAVENDRFHDAIEGVSGKLLRDGHYKQAALEAYIRVIDDVKFRSGLAEVDGDALMNRAFGSERQTSLLRFNSLQTPAEQDEQKGIFYLFKGVVGLRNAKAHSNVLFESPQRAHEYLALASLLLRLLEASERTK